MYILKQSKQLNKTGKLMIQMGKKEQRNITFSTASYANAFQVK